MYANGEKNMFEKARWIWRNEAAQADEHVDFVDHFEADKAKKYTLRISSDSNYNVYINGRFVSFGQYPDYPDYKVYDSIDITDYILNGNNRIAFTVWYYGITDSSTYHIGEAGLIFDITDDDGNAVCFSSEKTLSRLSPDYLQHKKEVITGQLGLTFHRDYRKKDDFINKDEPGFDNSSIVKGITYELFPRPVKKLLLGERIKSVMKFQGPFSYTCDRGSAPDMQHAAIAFYFTTMLDGNSPFFPVFGSEQFKPLNFKTNDDCDGIFILVDLKSENSGFAELEIDLKEDCHIDVGWGEHLGDGRCRTSVANFAFSFEAKKGRNIYTDRFRRIGCRYIQFFIKSKEVTIYYAGLKPTDYPIKMKKYESGNILRDTIYEVCENTLKQCMHEHYEDCPWREQALYTLDSRNQMLCGYYAFGEKEFPKACLRLMTHGVQENGLLRLVFPSSMDLTIPSYTCAYILQFAEYIKYTDDTEFAEECFPVLSGLMHTLENNLDPNGLIHNFTGENIWNFYEWAPTMMGSFDGEKDVKYYEAPFNAFYAIALSSMKYICVKIGREQEARKYEDIREKVLKGIMKEFWSEDSKLFMTKRGDDEKHFSVLTNAMCLLALIYEGEKADFDTSKVLRIIASNGEDNCGENVVPSTLSMISFRYDALLKTDQEKYKSVVLNEIDRDYLKMLRGGATTFWETILGENDLIGLCGSLCHGWSALPIYYYELLNTPS